MTQDDAAPPMQGVRVLDIATFIAAPMAAAILGEFGADVLKIEQPGGGDPWRRYGTQSKRADSSLAWLTEARNKRSITLNLRAPEGAALFKRLVAEADVVTENFRPGTLEKWGLGFDVLSAINPRLVLMRVSGYGQTGPYRDRPGFARIAHAFGGLTHLSGMPGGPPVTPGSTSLGDYMTGMYGAIGVLMALRERDRSGKGQQIDLALYEPSFRVTADMITKYAETGAVRERIGNRNPTFSPAGTFETKDGRYVQIAAGGDKVFERLAGAMDKPELASDPRYAKSVERIARADELEALVGKWIGQNDFAEVERRMVAANVPFGGIFTVADIAEDPHYAARENIARVPDPEKGEVVMPGVVPKMMATPGRIDHVGPNLGAYNVEVYGGLLGKSADELAKLKDAGVI